MNGTMSFISKPQLTKRLTKSSWFNIGLPSREYPMQAYDMSICPRPRCFQMSSIAFLSTSWWLAGCFSLLLFLLFFSLDIVSPIYLASTGKTCCWLIDTWTLPSSFEQCLCVSNESIESLLVMFVLSLFFISSMNISYMLRHVSLCPSVCCLEECRLSLRQLSSRSCLHMAQVSNSC